MWNLLKNSVRCKLLNTVLNVVKGADLCAQLHDGSYPIDGKCFGFFTCTGGTMDLYNMCSAGFYFDSGLGTCLPGECNDNETTGMLRMLITTVRLIAFR
jgi:hypothetical protein